MLKCIGCGATLQTENENKSGFVNKSALEKNAEDILCKRCFKLKHYNEVTKTEITNDDFLNLISTISDKKGLIIKIVDIFDFAGSFIQGLNRHVGNNEVILVGNKMDLLPKSVKANKVIHWMKKMASDKGLTAIDATVMSAAKGKIEKVIELINKHGRNKDVYVVGCTNVGKSSFVNQIIKKYFNQTKDIITVSNYPGTTLNFIEIPLNDKNFIIDTPGVFNEHQYLHYLSNESNKIITPKKEIKPKVYQLDVGQTLFVGALCRIDFINGDKSTFVCHFSNNLKIHRTKLINADTLYENHQGEMLYPPSKEELVNLGKLTQSSFKISGEKKDVVISGLGFITIKGKGNVVVTTPKKIGVFVRTAIIGD